MPTYPSDLTTTYKYRVISIASQSKVLLFKDGEKLYYRTGIFINVSPFQIPALQSFIDLFKQPSQLTVTTFYCKVNGLDAYIMCLFLDTDLADCPQKDYNAFLTASLKFHQQQLELLQKHIAIKDFTTKFMHRKQLANLSLGLVSKQVKNKYAYTLEFAKEKALFRKAVFSSNKIKKIDYKRDSIIPEASIVLGKTISNKDIGVNSPVLFLTGKKESRRAIVQSIITHLTQQDDHHLVIFDFGLSLTFEKTFFRQFKFDDIHFDPFSFSEKFSPSQHALFISHLSFIGKNILKLNDRQISIFEEKLASYLQAESRYSWQSFVAYVQDEVTDESLTNTLTIGSFSEDAASGDFTSSLKAVESPLKSNDFETLLNKLRYLEYIFAKADRSSLPEILFKNHLDVFTIASTPDLKSLSFYLFNLFYSLNQNQYHTFTFMFLDIDSILFDKFNDLDVSWMHADLKHSLFDASDIFAVKKIFNLLDTRIYTSYIANAPYSLLSKTTKEAIDKLQFLHEYCLLESPTLQRQEFFKLENQQEDTPLDLPPLPLFMSLVTLLFSRLPEWSYRQLFIYYEFRHNILKNCLNGGYLRKKGSTYILTDKAHTLKKAIIEFLAFQPPISLEEGDIISKYSDPVKYNLLFHNRYTFGGNIESLCTRYLSSQFTTYQKLNGLLLYQFLAFKQHLIDEKQLFYYFLVAIQTQDNPSVTTAPEIPAQALPVAMTQEQVTSGVSDQTGQSKLEIMQDYFSSVKTALEEDPQLVEKTDTPVPGTPASQPPKVRFNFPPEVQEKYDRINNRIHQYLPDKNISFPNNPIFLIMKFLDADVRELIMADLTDLVNTT